MSKFDNKAYTALRKAANDQGREDLVEQLDALKSQSMTFSSPLAAERLQGGVNNKESPYAPTYRNIEKLKEVAQDQGREDIVKQLNSLSGSLRSGESDISEEARGFAAIPAEQFTLGILGDEARAAGRAAVAVGLDALTGNNLAGDWDDEYAMALEDERRVEKETYQDHPFAAHSLGLAYGIVAPWKAAVKLGVGKTALEGAARQGGLGVATGAAYGFMEGEGLEDRLNQASTLGAIGGVLGAAGGVVGGRAAGIELAAREQLNKTRREVAANILRVQKGKDIGDPSDLYDLAKLRMDEKALAHMNQTNTPLTGPAMTQALKETAEELGVSLRRLRMAETSKRGSVFNYSDVAREDLITANADNFVPESISRSVMPMYKDFYSKGIQPIVNRARDLVGPQFAGKLQAYATKVAQRGDLVSSVFHTPAVKAFQQTLRKDKDGELRAAILNMSNIYFDTAYRQTQYEAAKKLIFNRGGEAAVEGFEGLRGVMKAQQLETKKFVNAAMEVDDLYWPAAVKQKQTILPGQRQTRTQVQQNLKDQKRGEVTGAEALSIYETPDVALDNAVRKSMGVSLLHEEFGLRNIGAVLKEQAAAQGKKLRPSVSRRATVSGQRSMKELVGRVQLEGAEEGTAQLARNLLESVAVNGTKGPATAISNFRKVAYMGTIGNPYSAILNIGDVFNSMLNFGADETIGALADSFRKKGFEVSVQDIGLMHQTTGEFLRDGVGKWSVRFSEMSDKTFKLSGFTGVDRFGKNVAMNAALKNNRKLASQGLDKFRERWGALFSEADIQRLHQDVLSGNKSQLVKQLAATELSKMQPTDLASMPQWFLDNPNARVLYMLRTFALKQIQQMENLIFTQWKQGNKKEAIKNGLAYMAVVGGGNAAVNEGRQVLKGDAPTLEGFGNKFADHLLGAATANTLSLYTLSRSINEGSAVHIVAGAAPPIGLVFAPIIDLGQIATAEDIDMKEALKDSEMFGWVPWGTLAQQWLQED